MTKLSLATDISSSKHWESIKRFDSAEGNVAKFVYEKSAMAGEKPAVVEAVLYKYPTYEERTVICCSTQSGCPMGCRFCGAGDYFMRSLDANEIVAQVEHAIAQTHTDAKNIKRLQIMFMSMGEPALNQKSVAQAIRQLHQLYPHATLLLSTSGPDVPYDDIFAVSQEIDKVGLQFSIHESTDAARDLLIPFKKKMNLEQIAVMGSQWSEATGRKPFFNYCADDHNSADIDASRIKDIFNPVIWEATISVVCERNEGLPTRNDYQIELAKKFSNKLLAHGFNTRVFDPAGQDDIGGGCGQLWYVQEKLESLIHTGLVKPSVGHSKPVRHTPCATQTSAA
jgi:23S rRNA (adenine2503-C2)-methyltransferase